MIKIYDFFYWLIGFVVYKIHILHKIMPLKMYLQQIWFKVMDYNRINFFRNPQTCCEKYNWLKLHDHNPLYHKLVDKYEVKKYVEERIGSEYIIKTLCLYNSLDEIDISKLPNQFILKCTHDSGSFVICKDKQTFDLDAAKKKLSIGLARKNYYRLFGEWAYKDVKPRIIAEEYIDSLLNLETEEYKVSCIDGKVKIITICTGIAHGPKGTRFNDHFDTSYNRIPFTVEYPPAGKILRPSKMVDEIIRICEKLSEGLPHVRVDLYYHSGKIYFGEFTFYTWGGFMNFIPKEMDIKIGEMFDVNLVKESKHYEI